MCKKVESQYEKAAELLSQTSIRLGKVDCTKDKVLEAKYNITAYPTFIFFSNKTFENYSGKL